MTQTDKVYLDLLKDVIKNGIEKNTRAGRVKSVFGRQLRFDLKEGFPLLTTKKIFTKGVIQELLWFLQKPYNSHGSMNIEYLIRNGVHIWDDDAYRWFKQTVVNKFINNADRNVFFVCLNDDYGKNADKKPLLEYWIENENKHNDIEWLNNITKEEFIDLTLNKVEIHGSWMSIYRFGDLGPVYGKQWRAFGNESIDQISNIIETLKTNPNDRRMLCVAFNPEQLEEMALPPCHVMMQFYTRELSNKERWELYKKKIGETEDYQKAVNNPLETELEKKLNESGIPVYGLSCMWTQRSVDCGLGLCFNISSYGFLTYMIGKLVNMEPDELIGSLGDCHIYEEHFDAVKEQLNRNGSDMLPKLIIHGNQRSIEDFKYEDFEIIGYNPDPSIKAPLLVGM